MQPNTNQQRPGVPADLPVLPAMPLQSGAPGGQNFPGYGGQPVAGVPMAMPIGQAPMGAPMTPAPTGSAEEVALRARQLVEQYGQDPVRLGAELSQLKNRYLAEHFHIAVNMGEK